MSLCVGMCCLVLYRFMCCAYADKFTACCAAFISYSAYTQAHWVYIGSRNQLGCQLYKAYIDYVCRCKTLIFSLYGLTLACILTHQNMHNVFWMCYAYDYICAHEYYRTESQTFVVII